MYRKAYRICLFLLAAVLIVATAACKGRDQKEENSSTGIEDSEQTISSQDPEQNTPESGETGNEAEDQEEKNPENGQAGETEPDEAKENKESDDDSTTDGADSELPVTSGDSSEKKGGPERIGIYTIDDETLETVSLTALIDTTGGLTPEAVVEAVALALEDHLIEIQIAGITVSEGKATVDIQAEDENQPFGNTGSSVENVILDCITYSLFDNFKEIKELYFTVNGGVYESGHISLEAGEPYQTK